MPTLLDSYSESNSNGPAVIQGPAGFAGIAQAFANPAVNRYLTSVKLYILKVGSPTGNAFIRIYNISGSYGTSAIPTGSPLASVSVNVATLPTSSQLVEFLFTGANSILLTASAHYAVTLEYANGDSSNYVGVGTDNTSPSHAGNAALYADFGGGLAWQGFTGNDNPFYVYGASYITTDNVAQSNALNTANTAMMATADLVPTESLPGTTSIAYALQTESGQGFVTISKNTDTALALPALSANASHKWKATLTGSVSETPVLDNLSIAIRKAMPLGATTDRLAQSFNSGAGGNVAALLLNIVKDISDSINYTVEIQADSAGSPSGTPITNGSATILAADVPNQAAAGSFSWIAAVFGTPPTLTAATTYWIVVKIGSAGSSKLLWRARGGNSYSSGAAKFSTNSGSAWITMTNDDFLFQVLAGGGTFQANITAKYKRRYR